MTADLDPEVLRLIRAADAGRLCCGLHSGYLLDHVEVTAFVAHQITDLVAAGLLYVPDLTDRSARPRVRVSDRGLLVLS
ncbi:hypothetical protein GCM10010172_07200 [Paractinoplanes ferrugineus]|uniref:Uncharacterized protein n=1 Tax=Paractinoplanes ferrugineus TaxID=113564 RepID=A0A919MEF0_9ACTN|nr:hypothetical protein [Actinoplanes ferrugineus]GIE16801.1 hypothetical protein Afe05nite_86410 [Actinoplanes ferrugineus]